MTIQDMAQALAARDAGITSSAEHANDDAPGWSQRAYDAVKDAPYLQGTIFSMHFARNWLYACGLDIPAEERAWGSVTQKLVRDQVIEHVGFERVSSSNLCFKPTYRLRTHGESE